MIQREWTLLFSTYDLRANLEAQLASIQEKARALTESRLLTASDELLSAEIASGLVVAPIELLEDDISVSQRDARIDVSHDFSRASWGDGPTYANGIEVTYHLPFTGDAQLWECRPGQYTMNPPRGIVRGREITFPIDEPGRNVSAPKKDFLEQVDRIKQWLVWLNGQVQEYNGKLEGEVRRAVVARRLAVTQTKADLNALGYKVRNEEDGSQLAMPALPKEKQRSNRRKEASRQFDVALSFAGEDRAYVEGIAKTLKDMGIEVFYDDFEQVQLWGADLAEHLGQVYGKQSRFVVIFASRHYAAKAWPNHEKQFALGRHLKGDTGRILPVRFDDTEIPGIPPTMGYLDLRAISPAKLVELVRQKVDSEDRKP